ncbi:zinc finger MYM-type 1-like [Paramuricea clavata]|uniref:Zinc finger MYM-type 1-like n=1 Tax=Paramuricea clavata TaxID=317549 RepID=A0A7D9ELX7_PARCT|nr:zinc finger MYM-type 1-like [Paramuricea clavata]
MKRVIDTVVHLGKQGLASRGHRESLIDDPEANKGNFLESLNYLSTLRYNKLTTANHLEKVRNQQAISRRKGGEKGAKGRGSKLTFLSNDTRENNVIKIIGREIASQIVKEIGNCRAWALIADTTPDVSHHEQLSICARIVNRNGKCSEHLLSCKRASGTRAMELYNLISQTLVSKGVSFGKLVAQTYDGASNMSGCYNGLQAIIKEKVGKHVAFVHCYAHTLNLVLSDSASVDVQVISLFNDLEVLYVLFSKTQRIHDLFEAVQLVLETVALDSLIDGNPRKTSIGLLKQIQTKQFLATAYLFREIFASTGPLSRYLQRVDVNFGKALGMVESAIDELNELRKEPELIIRYVEQKHDSPSVTWQQPRIRRRRRMDDENAQDEPAETPEDHWKRNTFYVSVDTILNSLKNRFEKNQPLLQAFSLFAPSRFPQLVKNFKTAHDLQACLNTFCETYSIDAFRCADELFNFVRSFEKFDCSTVCQQDDDDDSEGDDDYNDDDGEDNGWL